MVIAAVHSDQNQKTDPEMEDLSPTLPKTLEEYLANPVENYEWVSGELVEKKSMGFRHSNTQGNFYCHWRIFVQSEQLGGRVLVEPDCRTLEHGRKPDVAYLPTELLEQYGEFTSLSYPLIGEIISPTDFGEDIFLKPQEYLGSGALEVWLVFPKKHIFIQTQEQNLWLTEKDTAKTQLVLPGFEIEVAELLS
jgi:Uma2 family endonuclease